MVQIQLQKLPFFVCKLKRTADLSQLVSKVSSLGDFVSLTRTSDEVSLVLSSDSPTSSIKELLESDIETVEDGWKALKVVGPLDFSLTGILSAIAAPLAQAKIAIFAISTFDTDYILVKQDKLKQAIETLDESGHDIEQ